MFSVDKQTRLCPTVSEITDIRLILHNTAVHNLGHCSYEGDGGWMYVKIMAKHEFTKHATVEMPLMSLTQLHNNRLPDSILKNLLHYTPTCQCPKTFNWGKDLGYFSRTNIIRFESSELFTTAVEPQSTGWYRGMFPVSPASGFSQQTKVRNTEESEYAFFWLGHLNNMSCPQQATGGAPKKKDRGHLAIHRYKVRLTAKQIIWSRSRNSKMSL